MAHDDDAVELSLALDEAAQDADEIAADRAADATVVHLEDLLLGVKLLLDQRIVDTDLAELRRPTRARVREPGESAAPPQGRGKGDGASPTSFSITAIFLPCSCETRGNQQRARQPTCSGVKAWPPGGVRGSGCG